MDDITESGSDIGDQALTDMAPEQNMSGTDGGSTATQSGPDESFGSRAYTEGNKTTVTPVTRPDTLYSDLNFSNAGGSDPRKDLPFLSPGESILSTHVNTS